MQQTRARSKTTAAARRREIGTVAACAAAALVLAGAHLLKHRADRGRPVTPGQATPGGPSARSAASLSPNALLERLTEAVRVPDVAVFGLKGAAAIVPDARCDEAEWSDTFETVLSASGEPDAAPPPSVQCRWNDKTLFLAVRFPATADATDAPRAPDTCRVVLGGPEPASRIRFTISATGRASERLTFDQCIPIPLESWQGALRREPQGCMAELALSKDSLGLSSFQGGQTLSLALQTTPDDGEHTAPSFSPAYWLLDSLRGARATLLLLGQEFRQTGPTLFANGCVHPGFGALAWPLNRINATPGETFDVPLALWRETSAGDHNTPTAHLVCPDGVLRDLSLIRIDARGHQARALKRFRVTVPALDQPGLHEISITRVVGGDPEELASWPVWVTTDWVTPLREYLLAQRGRVEAMTAADAWHRSIAVAHVARTLGDLESARALNARLLATVGEVREAVAAVERGRPVAIPAGTSKLVLPGGSLPIELTVAVPPHYDPALPWPLYWGQAGLPNMIAVQEVGTAAMLTSRPVLEEVLHIDPDRRYLFDWCGNAYVATDMLVRQPEAWAAAALALRARWSPRAAALSNVPILLYGHPRGGEDQRILDTAALWMREQGVPVEHRVLPDYQHSAVPKKYLPDTARWLLRHRRQTAPRTVQCVSEGYEHTSAYWVRIDAITEPRRRAFISAGIEGDSVVVRTNGNVAGYTLHLDRAPLPASDRAVTIVEDGRAVGHRSRAQKPLEFRREPDRPAPAAGCKRPGMAGPIRAALAGRRFLVVVSASGRDLRRVQAERQVAQRLTSAPWFQIEPIIASDVNTTEDQIRSANVLLLGDPARHLWLQRFADRLPVRFELEEIRIGPRTFAGDRAGIVALCSNPLNDHRYLVLCCSFDLSTLEHLVQALVDARPFLLPWDCVIVEPGAGPAGLIPRWSDLFDGSWQPVENSPPVGHLKTAHPDWQWAQLLAAAVRRQTGSDVFAARDVIDFSPAGLVGRITEHDLYRCFRNDWLLQGRLTRSRLRRLLPEVLSSSPDAVVGGWQGGPGQPADQPGHQGRDGSRPEDLLTVVTPAEPEDLGPTPEPLPSQPPVVPQAALHVGAVQCRLVPTQAVECLVSFLREHPQIDLDALLDQQRRPLSKNLIEAVNALQKEAGL